VPGGRAPAIHPIHLIRGQFSFGIKDATIFPGHGFPRIQDRSELSRLTRTFSLAGRTRTGL